MFLWLLGLTDMVQRLQKLRTYLRACFHDVVENSFNRRCTIWISPTLYGLLSLVISRIHFLQRSWLVLFPRELDSRCDLVRGRGRGGSLLGLSGWWDGVDYVLIRQYAKNYEGKKYKRLGYEKVTSTKYCRNKLPIALDQRVHHVTVEGLKICFECKHKLSHRNW